MAALALSWGGAAPAQEAISPDDFLDRAEGLTLSFHDLSSGVLVGTEQFLSRSLTVWKPPGQPCVYGRVFVDGPKLCFVYDYAVQKAPVCWWPFVEGDRLMVRLARLSNAQIQEVQRISDTPLDCPSQPTS